MTAAVKPRALLALCVESGATVVIDNADELEALARLAGAASRGVPVALRLAPALPGAARPTRFGLGAAQLAALARRIVAPLTLHGVHFHLDGYDAGERVTALGQSVELVGELRRLGHDPAFVDMGGGIPMSYLDDEGEWRRFWEAHRAALRGERAPLTFDGHGLGLVAHRGEILGRANVYPYFQQSTRAAWLEQILRSRVCGTTIAGLLRDRGLQLRCEPGRSLLDGAGLTAARVAFRKQRDDGTWLIGVAMNRTQCRSTSEDFLVDPLLLPTADPAARRRERRGRSRAISSARTASSASC